MKLLFLTSFGFASDERELRFALWGIAHQMRTLGRGSMQIESIG
jgi:hypothetical protein